VTGLAKNYVTGSLPSVFGGWRTEGTSWVKAQIWGGLPADCGLGRFAMLVTIHSSRDADEG
jgi:hypothetical protein